MARPLDYTIAIKESAEELKSLLSKAHAALIKRRLRFLISLKTGRSSTVATAGVSIGLLSRGAEKMWALYKKKGIKQYIDYPFKGRKPTLSEADKIWLAEELNKDQTLTLSEAARKIKEHTGSRVALSPTAVHYIFKSLKVKKKTGRPAHIHKDEQKVEAFKKRVPGTKRKLWPGCLL